ncbi:hypothetical protein [Vibrio maritimus]|uniref:hypothetical protein n=1 Tax=Vibrio maritimus TaxID=990268 RepID=UPI003736DB06
MKQTYQTRIEVTPEQESIVEQYGTLHGQCERSLFAETIAKGIRPESVKSAYLKRLNITARQFNAVCRLPKGEVQTIKALRKDRLTALKRKVKK